MMHIVGKPSDRRGFTIIELIVVLVIIGILFFFVRQKIPGIRNLGSRNSSISSGVKFSPHVIPLNIAFDSRGGIILSCSGKIPTPLGTFEIYRNVSFPKKKTLTIVLGEKKHVYDLGDRSFKVDLPNDLKGKSKVEYDGDGNIFVIVPEPVT